MKDFFIKVRNNDIFEFFVISIILASAVLVGFRTYEESLNPEIFLYIFARLFNYIYFCSGNFYKDSCRKINHRFF